MQSQLRGRRVPLTRRELLVGAAGLSGAALYGWPALAASPAASPGRLESRFLPGLMRGKSGALGRVFRDPETFRAQVLVSVVEPGHGGKPDRLRRHGWRVDAEYFYPASALKTCAAIASMQRLEGLRREHPELSLDTPLRFHPAWPGDRGAHKDASNLAGGTLTLGHLIRQMSIVSNNGAFNRLYEFAGQRRLNESMWAAGLRKTQFRHRLSRFLEDAQQRTTPAIDLLPPGGEAVRLPSTLSTLKFPARDALRPLVGAAYLRDGERFAEPMDFSVKNQMGLLDLQNMLIEVVRPDLDSGIEGFRLSPAHRRFLKTAMGQLPGASKNPIWSAERYRAERFKPILGGLDRVRARGEVQVWNKAGRAYGFRIENAYALDRKTGRSFFFTAAVYANANRVLNDGSYQYKTVTEPFVHELAEAVSRALW